MVSAPIVNRSAKGMRRNSTLAGASIRDDDLADVFLRLLTVLAIYIFPLYQACQIGDLCLVVFCRVFFLGLLCLGDYL